MTKNRELCDTYPDLECLAGRTNPPWSPTTRLAPPTPPGHPLDPSDNTDIHIPVQVSQGGEGGLAEGGLCRPKPLYAILTRMSSVLLALNHPDFTGRLL